MACNFLLNKDKELNKAYNSLKEYGIKKLR